ncbi:MAG: benzoate/H(+) symporter BenE family transporter [Pseudoxanthomonas sp.]|nr:benzoate/H(+) symporter BenE family transporter [Pseudoxanthomonas sp.]
MPSSLRPSHLGAGLVAVLIGYAGTIAIVFQAAAAAGASQAELGSWLWALGVGTGLSTIGLSLAYRMPILTAWSTPGAALLVSALPGLSMAEAVAGFLCSSLLLTLAGVLGWFDLLLRYLPRSLAAAMLAGVLLRFGLEAFGAVPQAPVLGLAMLLAWLAGRVLFPDLAVGLTLLAGLLVAAWQGSLAIDQVELLLARPVWVTPSFSVAAVLGVGVPLFLVTMAAQNLPGIAVLRGNGYPVRAGPLVAWTGATGLVLAPLGGYGFNLAAITAAICSGPEADPQPGRRWLASLSAGIFYLALGLFGATVASLLAAMPPTLILVLAGLALLPTLAGSLATSLAEADQREAAILAFLVTGSGVNVAGLGSAFLGLLAGIAVLVVRRGRPGV